MYKRIVMVENDQVVTLNAALREVAAFLGGAPYEIANRIELTITTDSERMAEILRCILGEPPAPEPEPAAVEVEPVIEQAPVPAVAQAVELAAVAEAWPGVMVGEEQVVTSGPVEIHSVVTVTQVPEPVGTGSAPGGLIACNVAERSAICPYCHHSYIRTRKNQPCCKQREYLREHAKYQARKYSSSLAEGRA
jgi:hypothetical protein